MQGTCLETGTGQPRPKVPCRLQGVLTDDALALPLHHWIDPRQLRAAPYAGVCPPYQMVPRDVRVDGPRLEGP